MQLGVGDEQAAGVALQAVRRELGVRGEPDVDEQRLELELGVAPVAASRVRTPVTVSSPSTSSTAVP